MNLVLAVVYLSYELELCSAEKEVARCVLCAFDYYRKKSNQQRVDASVRILINKVRHF